MITINPFHLESVIIEPFRTFEEMLLGFRTKLKLNNRQKTIMAKHAGDSRWVFNWGLKAWSLTYKEGLKPTANKLKKFYTNYVTYFSRDLKVS